jgi:hypothetical protein
MLLFDDGLRRMTVRCLEERPDGFYYRRRIPRDLQSRYGGKAWRFESLHTKNKVEAAKRLDVLAVHDNVEWGHMRDTEGSASELTPPPPRRLLATG